MSGDSGPEGTRARILAIAAVEIRQIGPKRMTISGLASRLGMSHANVYRHFSGKPAILDAVLNTWLRDLENRLQAIVDGPDPADDKLERFLTTLGRAYAETLRQDGALFGLLGAADAAAREAERHARRVDAWIERIAEEGIATRLFAGSDARRLAALALDLTYRFCDPGAVLRGGATQGGLDSRRDRVIRWAVRALTGRK